MKALQNGNVQWNLKNETHRNRKPYCPKPRTTGILIAITGFPLLCCLILFSILRHYNVLHEWKQDEVTLHTLF